MKPAKGALIALATVLGALVLWKAHTALVLLAASLTIAATVGLVVEPLSRRGLPRGAALAIAYLAGLSLVAMLVWIVGRAIVVEAPREADRFAASYDALKDGAASVHGFARVIVDHLPRSQDVFREVGGKQSNALALAALDATRSLLDGIVFTLLSLVLSVYWAGRGMDVERLVRAVIGARRSETLFRHWRTLGRIAGARVRRALVESALCAVALGLALRLFGVEPWAIPAAAASLALLVPFVGPGLAVLVALVAGLTTSVALGVASGASALLIVVVLRGVIAPRLLPVSNANPLILVATAMVLASALGLLGLLLSPLVAEVATMLGRRLLARRIAARAARSQLATARGEPRAPRQRRRQRRGGSPRRRAQAGGSSAPAGRRGRVVARRSTTPRDPFHCSTNEGDPNDRQGTQVQHGAAPARAARHRAALLGRARHLDGHAAHPAHRRRRATRRRSAHRRAEDSRRRYVEDQEERRGAQQG